MQESKYDVSLKLSPLYSFLVKLVRKKGTVVLKSFAYIKGVLLDANIKGVIIEGKSLPPPLLQFSLVTVVKISVHRE